MSSGRSDEDDAGVGGSGKRKGETDEGDRWEKDERKRDKAV